MTAPLSASRRGSALLIVLGLLSFLMISAVAFSISMRTEYKAAAAYRQSVATRELLISAFTDARATVDYALRRQLNAASPAFDRDDPSTRTAEALAPFKYNNEDRYGRLIASYNPDAVSDTSIAYLLDDAVMRHIPPYIASSVYHTLELQNPLYGGGADAHTVGGGNGYRIDWSASWKPITALIPDDTDNQKDNQDYVPEAVIGRMAWAVVNLSDSLDINAIGSASTYRGIGLTGNEFAFGTAATGAGAAAADERYNLIAEDKTTTTPIELPLFASNADLAQYAAQVSSNMPLTLDNGEIFPYSWEDAVDQDGDGYYSPFSVYSFWPNAERKKEDGTRAIASSSASRDGPAAVIPCNEVTETEVSQAATGTGAEIASIVNSHLGATGDAGFNLVRMLADYIDQDSVPALFDSGATQDLYPNAQPTVERVPMVAEVSFNNEGWGNSGKIVKELEKQVEEAFDGLYPDGTNENYETADAVPQTLGDQSITLKISDVAQMIGLRACFPGGADSTESFTVEPEGIVGITAAGLAGTEEIDFTTPAKAEEATVGGGALDLSGGMGDIFAGTGSPTVSLKGSGIEISVKGDKIPVANVNKDTPEQPQEVRLSFLVDFLFRVAVKNGSDVVDLAPTDQGNGALRTAADYPSNVSQRFDRNKMGQLDSQYFRITRPLTVTFSLQWKIEEKKGDGGKITYTAKSEFKDKPKAESPVSSEFDFGATKIYPLSSNRASYLSVAAESGTWFTVDPRYNWLSPTLGVTGNAAAYGTGDGAFRANLSSPHWIFCDGEDQTSGNSAPSRVQEDYAAKNASIVPFVWGLKVEDIRYGHNDSGQLLLPAEIGFLPVPFATNDWHPNQRAYQTNSIERYYNTVAKASFFRTLPAVDLNDGAMDYTRYTPLTDMLKNFAGDNFPEEHRGIVHAFAGQDDYYTCQRLRQFAMLGIPSSITQAAKVTFDRLTAASTVSRVSPEMLSSDLKSLNNETIQRVTLKEPKYDTFIRDYLFYVPDGPRQGGEDSWSTSQEPYEGASSSSTPYRVRTADDIILQQDGPEDATFVEKLKAYNDTTSADKLGQNDMTTLLAVARECFGDRQQLFLYILRADSIAYNSSRDLSQLKTLATARAVALVWRDAYGELPDRVVYYQLLP